MACRLLQSSGLNYDSRIVEIFFSKLGRTAELIAHASQTRSMSGVVLGSYLTSSKAAMRERWRVTFISSRKFPKVIAGQIDELIVTDPWSEAKCTCQLTFFVLLVLIAWS